MKYELSMPDQWLALYGDTLYRYCLTRVGNSAVAEDLVQETLLAALKAKENYAGISSEQTWLMGILKHKLVDYFRKTSRENTEEYFEGYSNNEEDDYFDAQGHWQVDMTQWSKPDKQTEQEQFFKTLETCIAHLPPKMAQIFILHELDGMKSEEICTLMTISSRNNFWVILSRIRQKLRHCLNINWVNQ